MPLIESHLAVVKRGGLYKDLDSGDKDALNARDIVRLAYKRGASWVVDPGPGANAMLVPAKHLIAFKDPRAAEKKYKTGSVYGKKGNPFAEALVSGLGAGVGFAAAKVLTESVRGRRIPKR